jgi:hypothetical protein
MKWRRRLGLWLLERLSFEDFALYVEGLVARAERAPGPGDVVVPAEKLEALESKLRAHHRREFPHVVTSDKLIAEIVSDLDLASAMREIGKGAG